MCSLKESKTQLRRSWKEIRGSVPHREDKSRQIQEKFLTYSAAKQAKSVFLYLSVGSEVNTLPILEELLRRGVQVSVPRCHKETGTMDAVAVTDLSLLKPGAYGILEPDPALPTVSIKDIDLAVVPALAFDKEGYRLGYGGGYYDRFLAEFSGTSVGLAFSDCITEHLPREEFDQPVDIIIWEGFYARPTLILPRR